MAGLFQRKYAVATDLSTAGSFHVRVQIRKAGSADFAVSADWTPATGDVKVAKDGAAFANITTLPAYTNGAWQFSFSGTELTAKLIEVRIVDSATKAVDDEDFQVETFGNASAMYPASWIDAVRLGLTALPNVAADAYNGLWTGSRLLQAIYGTSGNVWYVSKTGSDANDGKSFQTAKLTIQAAATASAAGDAILIGAGAYSELVTVGVNRHVVFAPGASITYQETANPNATVLTLGADCIIDRAAVALTDNGVGGLGILTAISAAARCVLNAPNVSVINTATGDAIALVTAESSVRVIGGALSAVGDTTVRSVEAAGADLLGVRLTGDVLQSYMRRCVHVSGDHSTSIVDGASAGTVDTDQFFAAKVTAALPASERTAIANEVEAQIIDDTDSEKVLLAITNKIAAVNPSLAGLTLGAIAIAVRDVSNASAAANSLGAAVNTGAASAATAATQATAAATSAATAATQSTAANTAIGTANTALTAIKGSGWVTGDNLHQLRADIAGVSGGGGGGGEVTGFSQAALAQLVTDDTGETVPASGSVAALSGGSGSSGGNDIVALPYAYGRPAAARIAFDGPHLRFEIADSISFSTTEAFLRQMASAVPLGGLWFDGKDFGYTQGIYGASRALDWSDPATASFFAATAYSLTGALEFQFNGTTFGPATLIFSNRLVDYFYTRLQYLTAPPGRIELGMGGQGDWLQTVEDARIRGLYYGTGNDAANIEQYPRSAASNTVLPGTAVAIPTGTTGEWRAVDSALDVSGVGAADDLFVTLRGVAATTPANGKLIACAGWLVQLPMTIPHWNFASMARGGAAIADFLDTDNFPLEAWANQLPLLNPDSLDVVVTIALGTNEPNDITVEGYTSSLQTLIARVRTGLPGAYIELIAPYATTGIDLDKLQVIADAMRAVVDADERAYMLDLYAKFPVEADIDRYLDAGVHPTGFGKGWYRNETISLAQGLAEAGTDDVGATAEEIATALAATVPISVISPVQPHRLDVFRGDALTAVQGGRTITFTKQASEPWPDQLDEAHFYAEPSSQTLDEYSSAASLTAIACTVLVATGEGQSIQLDLTATVTASLPRGTRGAVGYVFWIVANKSSLPATIRSGTMIVRPNAAAAAA